MRGKSHEGAILTRLRPITWAMKLLVRSWWNGVIVRRTHPEEAPGIAC